MPEEAIQKLNDGRDDNQPHKLSMEDWKELLEIPAIRESWGLEADATVEDFASQVYAAKFDFVSGGSTRDQHHSINFNRRSQLIQHRPANKEQNSIKFKRA